MNKERAIEALETERLNSSEAVIVVENGAQYFTAPTLYNAGLKKAIDILRALPDETPTVLTRETLRVGFGALDKWALTEINGHGAEFTRGHDLARAEVRQILRDALLALSPVVVEGRPCANCSASLVRCYDVSNPWAMPRKVKCCPDCDHRPVAVEGPVECPHVDFYGNRWDGQTMWGKPFVCCPDCGTRLQGGE